MEDRNAVDKLTALAHLDRLAAFRLLVKAGPEGVPSGEIASRLGIAPTRMSFHLSNLERSGLVTARRSGRQVHYAVNFEDMRELLVFLTEDCCANAPEICGVTNPFSKAIPSC